MPAPNGRFTRVNLDYLLSRGAEAAREGLEDAVKKRGLSLHRFRILCVLRDEGSCPITRLADICMAAQSVTSRAVDVLAQRGLMARAKDSRDMRVSVVALTAKGEALADELVALAAEHEVRALERFPMLANEVIRAALLSVVEIGA